MILTENELPTAAMELESPARARLAERLLQIVAETSAPPLNIAWAAELHRRVEEYDRGEVQSISRDQVMAELTAKSLTAVRL